MNINFISDYPWWFLLFCLLTGAAAAALLYYRNNREDFSPRKKKLLAAFRFGVITLLCFFLLSPLLKMTITQKQEPIILFFQDNSQSVITGNDSLFMQTQYMDNLQELFAGLEQDYDFQAYAFGEDIREAYSFDFSDKTTDMSEIIRWIQSRYSNRNIGAVIIAGDAIYNRGQNPLYMSADSWAPFYTLALGDTTPRRDLIINRLNHNRITYLNNIFPLEITIEARQARGSRSTVRVIHEGETVFEQDVSFTSNTHFETLLVQLEALEPGIQRYRVEIDPIADEITLANNTQEFFIEVIDSRQKILILANAPHPDVGALKMALEDNENYEVKVSLIKDFDESIREYNLIIWHQLPSSAHLAQDMMNQANLAAMPQLFVLGTQSNIPAFNRLQTGLQIQVRSAQYNDARAEVNENFNLFQLSSDIRQLLPQLPPLSAPFASYNLAPAAQVLGFQRIGNVSTQYPLVVFSESGERKTGIITGEGIWRWRLGNYARNNSHDMFNDLVSRSIQFLSVVEDKSLFRLNTQNFLYENQPAIFEAELYNRSYELVNEPDVHLTITNDEGLEFDYIFSRTGTAYQLNAGVFPVGEYQYRANVRFGQETFTAEEIFTVSPLNLETLNTIANHNLLFQMAENTGAQMFYPGQEELLLQAIKERTDIRPVLYTLNEYEDLINLRWIFWLLLLLLSVEWFIRKYSGSY